MVVQCMKAMADVSKKKMKPKEQCAYKKLGIPDEICKDCDGYREDCFKYTTIDHIRKWNEQRSDRDEVGRLDDIDQPPNLRIFQGGEDE